MNTQCVLTLAEGLTIPFKIVPCGFCGAPVTLIEHLGEVFVCDGIGGSVVEGYPLSLANHRCEIERCQFPIPEDEEPSVGLGLGVVP